ncbi:Prefoldin subunit-domain-containing protein [Xylaria nigripes]|nr:Prefoldin subunit-domain-containing protein [Xylaria nigripes]
MSDIRDPLQDLNKHLRQLEEQVDKLIIALDEWRQWKQEYEALHADVQALPPTATSAALCQTRQSFKAELVDEKELVDIFGPNDSKKRDQIISTVSNRLDYVSKNITTLSRQLETAENKLAAGRVVESPDATDEDGLPITEIREELDEDDNVVSYTLRKPGDSRSQLLDALDKAGIKDLPSGTHESTSDTPLNAIDSSLAKSNAVDTKYEPRSNGENAKKASIAKPPSKKKSVTFTEDTKSGNDEEPDGTSQRLEELYRQAKEQESPLVDPVRPADESPEDAELREDMIRYNRDTMMYEMAPIVAELQLEEGSDDDWGSDDSEEDADDDEEDQWGRSTSGVVDDEYKRQMLELKERLSKKTFGEKNASDDEEDDEFTEGIGRITVRHEDAGPSPDTTVVRDTNEDDPISSTSKDGVQKRTRFASSLDIIEPEPTLPLKTSTSQPDALQPQLPTTNPVSDVMERPPSGPKENISDPGRKVSKFRRDKMNGELPSLVPTIAPEKPTETARYAPSGPEGRTLATEIHENEPSGKITEPDELDANLLHQQVTEEFYKMRNKMIYKQGGFLKENTDAIQPLEEEEGGPKRISRFKAARLAKS